MGVAILNGAPFYKSIATLGFFCIVSALCIIAITPPASGYEISIYTVYPDYFWLLLIAAIACGIIILVCEAFSEKPSRWWIAGFLTISFTNLVILLLPVFRGYLLVAITRGDELTHIGYIKDILLTGHFASAGQSGANFYPAIHIIGADVSLVCGLPPELLTELLPILFTLFYIFSIYLLSRVIATSRGQAILITAFGSLLLMRLENLIMAPGVAVFCMLPFTLFLFFKSRISTNRASYSLPFILVLVVTPFLQPGEGSVFLILIFICVELSLWWYRRVKNPLRAAGSTVSFPKSISSIYPSLILFAIWFSWVSLYSSFAGMIYSFWTNAITATEYADLLAKAGLSLSQFTQLFLQMWGQAVIYGLVAVVICIFAWKRFLSPKGRINAWQFIFSCLFIVFGILLFVAFFSRVILVDYGREARYVIFAATVLNGLGLYGVFRNWHKTIGKVFIIALLVASAIIGIFNTFPSPIVVQANSQVTEMEMTGMAWFFEHRDNSLLIDERGVTQQRFWAALYGASTYTLSLRFPPIPLPPDHFGYLGNSMYGESDIKDRYYVDSKLSRIIYPELSPDNRNFWKVTPEDFFRLDHEDISVNRLFSNGEFWVYYVRGVGSRSSLEVS